MNAVLGQSGMMAVWLNNFQLRDKQQLLECLEEASLHGEFVGAVKAFVDEFVQSYAADAPYPRRIGRWIGLHAPLKVIENLSVWSSEADPTGHPIRYRREFRDALELARTIDRDKRPRNAA